jgi:tetratricopeptide (TPR) repeat protein
MKLAPDHASTHFMLAYAYYAACQADRMRVEAERVVALNPNGADALGPLGNFLAFAGDWDYGRQLAEKAIELAGPSAQSWWWWATAKGYYHKGDYAKANEYFLRAYTSGSWLDELHEVRRACRCHPPRAMGDRSPSSAA